MNGIFLADMSGFFIGLFSVLLGIVSVLLVLIVLMQRPKQEGLGAAFGGGMTDQMFGAQTTNVLQKGTVYLAVMFFVFALIISVLTAKSERGSTEAIDELTDTPAEKEEPATTPPFSVNPSDLAPNKVTTTPPVTATTPPVTATTPIKVGGDESTETEKPEEGTEGTTPAEGTEGTTKPEEGTDEGSTEPAEGTEEGTKPEETSTNKPEETTGETTEGAAEEGGTTEPVTEESTPPSPGDPGNEGNEVPSVPEVIEEATPGDE